ncbi:hypothetical protein MIH18_15640 [Marinobacter sp. M3C]|uniref:hypothetical protein n=1 Tax=Marinobacter sp. M3C TaxID=2917715 RepID=UPI00200C7665|nr:hypothetical protein [Marinobacter sp. M3C]UQG59176.1 hypothetical protein MIH18_15640 [Marinobacter sp. M3C]
MNPLSDVARMYRAGDCWSGKAVIVAQECQTGHEFTRLLATGRAPQPVSATISDHF